MRRTAYLFAACLLVAGLLPARQDTVMIVRRAAAAGPPAGPPDQGYWEPWTGGCSDNGGSEQVDTHSGLALGQITSFDKSGWVFGVYWLASFSWTTSETVIVSLYATGGSELATKTASSKSADQWNYTAFDDPVQVSASTDYTAVYHLGGSQSDLYCAAGSYHTSAFENGDVNVPTAAGVYYYGAQGTEPTDTFNNASYFADVAFLAD